LKITARQRAEVACQLAFLLIAPVSKGRCTCRTDRESSRAARAQSVWEREHVGRITPPPVPMNIAIKSKHPSADEATGTVHLIHGFPSCRNDFHFACGERSSGENLSGEAVGTFSTTTKPIGPFFGTSVAMALCSSSHCSNAYRNGSARAAARRPSGRPQRSQLSISAPISEPGVGSSQGRIHPWLTGRWRLHSAFQVTHCDGPHPHQVDE